MNAASLEKNRGLSPISLEAEGLECVRNDVVLFNGLSFRVGGGEILQILGPNGSGKTSLLRMLCGLLPPNAGEVYWNGQNIRDFRPEFNRAISYVGHNNGIKTQLTPLENLAFTRDLFGPRTNGGLSPREALQRLELAGVEQVPAGRLSSGQRRRVALSRLLLMDAALWLLDEPFSSLDRSGGRRVETMIADHVGNGGLVVLAAHDPVAIGQCRSSHIRLSERFQV